MTDILVYGLLFGLLAAMPFAKEENRFFILFTGIVTFPIGIAFKQSPTIRPMDLFLYGFFFIEIVQNPQKVIESAKTIPLKLPLVLIFVSHILSTGLSSGFGMKNIYTVFREFFELYGFLFAAYLSMRNCSLNDLAKKLFPLTLILCILGILEVVLQGNYPYTVICSAFPIYTGYYTLDHIVSMIQDWRIRTMITTAHPTALGTLLGSLTILYICQWKNLKKKSPLTTLTVLLLTINLILCGSRTAMLTTFIGILFIFLHKKSGFVKIFFAGISFFLVAFGTAIIIQKFSNESQGSSFGLRQRQLIFSAVQIANSPIFGNGVGATKNIFEYDDSGRPINDSDIGGLESIVFRQLIDYGFVGLASFYFFAFCLFWNFYKKRDQEKNLFATATTISVLIFFTLSGLIGNNGAFAFLILGSLLNSKVPSLESSS